MDFTVLDFWGWANSDLLGNRERGILAEFLVAKALGAAEGVRIEWDAKDLVTPDGIEVEVKSAAYLQSWKQDDYSSINYSVGLRKGWDAGTDTYATEYSRRADVYVMCLLNEKDPEKVDPLDLSQWTFWVVSRNTLNQELGDQEYMALSTLKRIAGNSVSYDELRTAVRRASRQNDR